VGHGLKLGKFSIAGAFAIEIALTSSNENDAFYEASSVSVAPGARDSLSGDRRHAIAVHVTGGDRFEGD